MCDAADTFIGQSWDTKVRVAHLEQGKKEHLKSENWICDILPK